MTSASASPFASSLSFTGPTTYPTGVDPQSVAIGDLNGDGKPDLVTPNGGAGAVSVLINRGGGTFEPKRAYRAGHEPRSVALGDLDGDNEPDLVTANGDTDSVSVLLNRGGAFQPKSDYRVGSYSDPTSVGLGDLNGDGKLDVVTANFADGGVSALLNAGDGRLEAKTAYRTGCGPWSVAIGDLTGHGKPDLTTANHGANTVSVLLNRGDGSFRAKRDYTGAEAKSVAIGDLNGDGSPDLATANYPESCIGGRNESPCLGFVSVRLNRGDGSFRARRDYRIGAGAEPESVAIGDLNADGKPDVAAPTNAGLFANTVSVLVNKGDGSFEAKRDYRTGESPWSVAIGDLNGDGNPDLATANPDAKAVFVLLNTRGLCTAQDVKRKTLRAAKRTLARFNCRVGKIRRAYSRSYTKGRVISEKPKPGTVLPKRGKVNLVVSRGRRPS